MLAQNSLYSIEVFDNDDYFLITKMGISLKNILQIMNLYFQIVILSEN